MTPSRFAFEDMVTKLRDSAATFDAPAGNLMHIAKAAFVPSLDLTLASLTEADFTGAAAINVNLPATTFYDVATGLMTLLLTPPVGGWVWHCTATPTPPQVIFGFYVTISGGGALLASALLPRPITISSAGQGMIIDEAKFQFSPTSPN
jgi:hypothetical protein